MLTKGSLIFKLTKFKVKLKKNFSAQEKIFR